MANEVATRGAALATVEKLAGPVLEGLESITDRRILGTSVPEIRIRHSVRSQKDVGLPGQFYMGQNPLPGPVQQGKPIPPLQIVVLKGHVIRMLREGEDNHKKVVCASRDGVQPLHEIESPRHHQCSVCDYSQFKDPPTPGAKKIMPPCQMGIAFFVMIPQYGVNGEDQPAWFCCTSVGASIRAQEFIRQMRQVRGITALHQVVVSLTTEARPNAYGGTTYDPIFSIKDDKIIPHEQYAEVAAIVKKELVYTPYVDFTAAGNGAAATSFDPATIEVPGGTTGTLGADDL